MAGEGTRDALVCVGDSVITAERSWGYLLAQAGGWTLVRHSARGARSRQVLDQLPRLHGCRYAVGALTVGANDVLFDWDPGRYDANLRTILDAMDRACDRVLVQTFPRSFRRFAGSSPRRREATAAADAIIRGAAEQAGAALVDAADLSGRLLCPDRVHPSVLGHRLLAERAAAILGLPHGPSAASATQNGDHDNTNENTNENTNQHGRRQYLATTAKTTVREVLARIRETGTSR